MISARSPFAFGQTIQYVLDILNDTSIGRMRRPLMRIPSRKRRASERDTWPSTAASISMLARVQDRSLSNGAATPSASKPSRTSFPVIETQQRKFFKKNQPLW